MKKKVLAVSLTAAMLMGTLTACSGGSSAGSTAKGEWPSKAVQVVVTASAGGDTDFNAVPLPLISKNTQVSPW